VLDGVEYEKKGIPTAVICTDAFKDVSSSVTEIHELTDYQVHYVPHPISARADALLSQSADEVYESVANWLKKGG
jgi:hypothetical protein